MKKSLIIGLDLSFSCTGITIAYLEENIGRTIEFHRIIHDKQKNKRKIFVSSSIQNVSDLIYRMPSNITPYDLIIDEEDKNNIQQCEATLKSMIASKYIKIPILNAINYYKPDTCYFAIENYIMPAYGGQNQLKTVGGLIMLQGFIRKFIIQIALSNNIPSKLLTPTPSKVKLFFSKNGRADKFTMVKAFFDYYDGKKLLPSVTLLDTMKIDDVVDSFALVMYTYNQILTNICINQ